MYSKVFKILKIELFKPFLIFVTCFFTLTAFQENEPKDNSVIFFIAEYRKDFHPNLDFSDLIFVSVKNQKLYYLKNNQLVAKYAISTSRFGVGNKIKSQKTPLGLHVVKHKIGNGTPVNGIIKYGTYAGENANIIHQPEHTSKDIISTRVLWLEGLEPGINKGKGIDSYERSIYIHGTAEEGLIGQPASHGCIRMKNAEVLELFNKIPKNTYVLILDH